jgi:hypothetical protein
MFAYLRKSLSSSSKPSVKRSARPLLENLEDRLLLYSAYGGTWAYGSRITYSFMPDGTSVGGTPSVLFQTLNAKFTQANWELQFQKAAAVWQAVANINLSQVSDNGSPEATSGNQQDDPRFGDIRVGMVNLGSGVLGETLLPPPFNGGTDAGDMFLNSTASWQINTSYDLETVAIHEFGHALGLGESQITTACMYAYYNGVKQSLTSDDIAGIQAVWGAPQSDQFNSNGQSDASFRTPANITSYIDSNSQIAIPSLRITSSNQSEWFSVTVPSSTTGTMVVTDQSSNLSMLSPSLYVETPGSNLPVPVGTISSTALGATVSYTVTGVQAGQTYLIRACGNSAGDPTGGFGLEVNFGSATQPPIAPPNTVVPQQPDQGGGTGMLLQGPTGRLPIAIGNLSGQGIIDLMNAFVSPNSAMAASQSSTASTSGIDSSFAVAVLNALAATQPDQSIATWVTALAAAGQMNSSSSGTTLSTLQAIDAAIFDWNVSNLQSLFT